jgi:hypothetical protein
MSNDRKNNRPEADPGDMNENRLERYSSRPGDLPDSKEDREQMRTEESFMDLPDVKDIPGQEFVNAPPAGVLGDTTISSDDEEGRSVFDRGDEEHLRSTGTGSDVSREERTALEQVDYLPTRDADNLQEARMDNVDFQNEPLNEKGFGEVRTASDLDVPGAELDDRDESIGEEDEENNDYSTADGER